jgi:hypothetical protein
MSGISITIAHTSGMYIKYQRSLGSCLFNASKATLTNCCQFFLVLDSNDGV